MKPTIKIVYRYMLSNSKIVDIKDAELDIAFSSAISHGNDKHLDDAMDMLEAYRYEK